MVDAAAGAWLTALCGHVRKIGGIQFARFYQAPALPHLAERLPAPTPAPSGRNAAEMPVRQGSWHQILGSMTEQGEAPSTLLAAALFHRPLGDAVAVLDVEKLTPLAVGRLIRTAAAEESVVLSSVVATSPSARHMCMLDFAVPPSTEGLELARETASSLRLNGMLVNSGRSYHFYGDRLLNTSKWRELLLRASLLAPIVDGRWITHQLLQGYAGLRVSPHPSLGSPPVVEMTTVERFTA
jgi:hypothetical protein